MRRTRKDTQAYSAHVRAGVLLTLCGSADRVTTDERAGPQWMPAAALADALQLEPSTVRVAINQLLRARCLRVGPARGPYKREVSTGGHCYGPPPSGAERGPGRAPRVYPVALVIDEDAASTEIYCATLRKDGTLPVAVESTHDALTLLRHLAFELVIMCVAGGEAGPQADEANRVNQAAREAGSGGFLVLSGPDGAAHALRQLHSTLTYAPVLAAVDR